MHSDKIQVSPMATCHLVQVPWHILMSNFISMHHKVIIFEISKEHLGDLLKSPHIISRLWPPKHSNMLRSASEIIFHLVQVPWHFLMSKLISMHHAVIIFEIFEYVDLGWMLFSLECRCGECSRNIVVFLLIISRFKLTRHIWLEFGVSSCVSFWLIPLRRRAQRITDPFHPAAFHEIYPHSAASTHFLLRTESRKVEKASL